MSKIAHIGLAAALVIGSASMAFAQSNDSGVERVPSHAARSFRSYSDRQISSQPTNPGPNSSYEYHQNTSPEQPWSTSMDPGNTNGD
jgi:hypothetical protein